MNSKLDAILKILYDKNLLLWKSVSSVDIIAFGKQKFNLTLTDPEITYVLEFLEKEGYLRIEKEEIPWEYALTVKGIKLVQSGGFKWQSRMDFTKASLLYVSYFAVIVAGWYYAIEIYKFYWRCKC